MTPLPRDTATFEPPIRNYVGLDAQRLCDGVRATKGRNEVCGHAALSQIVTVKASPNIHNLCVAKSNTLTQIVSMEDQEKNGGPNFLREWRMFRKLSQAELAELVGTNANMIGYLENGERGLSAKWLRRLAPALSTTPGMLLDHDPAALDSDILEIWGKAGDREKRQISEIAKTLVRDGTGG